MKYYNLFSFFIFILMMTFIGFIAFDNSAARLIFGIVVGSIFAMLFSSTRK